MSTSGIKNKASNSGLMDQPQDKRILLEIDSHRIVSGEVYIIEEPKPSFFFDIYAETSVQGFKTLLITREYPERVKSIYNGSGSNVIWLTHVVGRECIEPTQTNLILKKIVSFTKDNSPCIVMLDGVEYLINQNGFDLVMGFLNHIRDLLIIRDSVLLVSLDTHTLEKRELALLERNMNIISGVPNGKPGAVLALESGVIKIMKTPNSKR